MEQKYIKFLFWQLFHTGTMTKKKKKKKVEVLDRVMYIYYINTSNSNTVIEFPSLQTAQSLVLKII